MPTTHVNPARPRKLRPIIHCLLTGALVSVALTGFAVSRWRVRALAGATLTVNTTMDVDNATDGLLSLREAILISGGVRAVGASEAGQVAGTPGGGLDNIVFALGAGTPTINVTGAPLPPVTNPMFINGNTGGATRMELNGAAAGGGSNGLAIFASNSRVKSLVVNRFNGSGILIQAASGVTVEDCYLGTDAAGTAALGNNIHGVQITGAGATNNLIGGTAAGARNLLSGNGQIGASIAYGPNGNRVEGNYIGSDVTGTAALPNNAGVEVVNSANNVIGGTAVGAGNLISGNRFSGIAMFDGANGNRVEGNRIGTNAAGTAALANPLAGVGIYSDTTNNNVIGGTAAGARNLISGNGANGVELSGGTFANRVESNYIGTNLSGTGVIPNGQSGVFLTNVAPFGGSFNTTNNVIGGTAAGAGNVISGNSQNGVLIVSGANNTRVEGNYIGTNATGTGALGNNLSGVCVSGPNNQVGGTMPGAGNLIAFNLSGGIWVTNGTGNAVRANALFDNAANPSLPNSGLGIDLRPGGAFGLTPNDAGDGDTGVNNLQNFPVLSATGVPGVMNGSLDSTAANSAYPVRLEFFVNTACDASGNGEGESFVGAMVLNAPGAFTFNFTPVPGKSQMTATATDANGNTSEFSACTFTPPCNVITLNPASLPLGTTGAAYTQSLSATGAVGATVFTLVAGALPTGLSCSPSGLLAGVPVQSGTFNFTVKATDSFGCMGLQAYTLMLNCPSLTLNPPALPPGTAGAPYNQALTASGAFGDSASFIVNGGALPSGLTLSPAGLLAGTPVQTGMFDFTVKATDSLGCLGTGNYTLTVNCSVLGVNPANLPNAQAGVGYSQSLTALGSIGAAAFSLNSGALPAGLTLQADGTLACTPTATGTATFEVKATDTLNPLCMKLQTYTLTTDCPAFTLAALPAATAGAAYSALLAASPAGGGYTFSGTPPAGLTLAGNGALTGTPATSGTFNFNVTVTGFGACMQTLGLTLAVGCPALTFTPASLPSGNLGAPYNATVTAEPAGGQASYAATGLPNGLTMAAATGVLSGTPTQQGVFTVSVSASGFGGCAGTRVYSLFINSCVAGTISLTPATLPGGTVGVDYGAVTVTASPAGSYTYVMLAAPGGGDEGGGIPPGLSINAATGVLGGTPQRAGVYNVVVRATSLAGCFGTRAYTMVIGCPAGAAISPASLPNAALRTSYNRPLSVTGGAPGMYVFSLTAGALPTGLHLTGAGVLAGSPVALGTFAFTVRAANAGQCAVTKAYTLTVVSALARAVAHDFDGDGRSDLFHYDAGQWTIVRSGDGVVEQTTLGGARDVPVAADYDGDGRADRAVFRVAEAQWWLALSGTGAVRKERFGEAESLPTPADFDGDGRADLAVFARGVWWIRHSGDGQVRGVAWGAPDDVPAAADYDGDGRADVGVYRAALGSWLLQASGTGETQFFAWGAAGDLPLRGDFDGDGRDDAAVWRVGEGRSYARLSQTGALHVWQELRGMPLAGDYAGDGRCEIAVWSARDGVWRVARGADGQ